MRFPSIFAALVALICTAAPAQSAACSVATGAYIASAAQGEAEQAKARMELVQCLLIEQHKPELDRRNVDTTRSGFSFDVTGGASPSSRVTITQRPPAAVRSSSNRSSGGGGGGGGGALLLLDVDCLTRVSQDCLGRMGSVGFDGTSPERFDIDKFLREVESMNNGGISGTFMRGN